MPITFKSMKALKLRKEHIQPIVLILTLLWAIYTFIWKENISGKYAPPKLKIDASLQLIKRTQDYQLARINFSAHNIGDQTINILTDLWKITEINHKIITRDQAVQDFDARFADFLSLGSDAENIERVRTTYNGNILAAGSLGWNSLKSGESQKLTDVIALPLTSKEISLSIIVPYAKNLNRDSATWINWTYNKTKHVTAIEICTSNKLNSNTRWHCVPQGSGDYKRLLTDNEIRFAYDESAYVP
jgi:hypothetical protein